MGQFGSFLVVGCLLLPGTTLAAPLQVTYEITGGTLRTIGSDSIPVTGGNLVITLPNPGSGDPPIFTERPRVTLDLFAGGYHQQRDLNPRPGLPFYTFHTRRAYRGALQTLSATVNRVFCAGHCDDDGWPAPGRQRFHVSATAAGNLQGQFFELSTATAFFFYSWSFTGREVSAVVPESSSGLLLALGLGMLTVVAATPRLRRRSH